MNYRVVGLRAVMLRLALLVSVVRAARYCQEESEISPAGVEDAVASKVFPEGTSARSGLSRLQIEVTNRRYQNDPFWGGPKGMVYSSLLGAQDYQVANLYPDAGTSYFVAWFLLPKGGKLIIQGEYGHLRYFSYTAASFLGSGSLGNGDFLVDRDIEPDAGSFNPFDPENKRDVSPRNYTVYLINGNAPEHKRDREVNTVYTGSDSLENKVHLALRNYIPDVGYDGAGCAPLDELDGYGLPTVSLELDGKTFTGKAMRDILLAEKRGQTAGSNVTEWLNLVKSSHSHESAPSLPVAAEPYYFQRFWNTNYSGYGAFILDPEERVKTYPADAIGGLLANPDTVYMVAAVSLARGQLFVVKAKMPKHSKTRHGEKDWDKHDQLRYWSASSGGTLPSGWGWDTVYDEEMPLDDNGYFTLVMSWPEDRPANARVESGVNWLDFGSGEGRYVGARNWVNVLYIRYQHMSETWLEAPAYIPQPKRDRPIPLDAAVMQDYYPLAKYMSKDDFEELGDHPVVTIDKKPAGI